MEQAKLKIDVSVCCSSLGQIIQSACAFPDQVSEIKTLIVHLNSHLEELHKKLHLPFAVVLTIEEMISHASVVDDAPSPTRSDRGVDDGDKNNSPSKS
jgi:hypothetical protein